MEQGLGKGFGLGSIDRICKAYSLIYSGEAFADFLGGGWFWVLG